MQSCGVILVNPVRISVSRSSLAFRRASLSLIKDLNFAKHSSMGIKSGLYAGKKRTNTPNSSRDFTTVSTWWIAVLSSTITLLGFEPLMDEALAAVVGRQILERCPQLHLCVQFCSLILLQNKYSQLLLHVVLWQTSSELLQAYRTNCRQIFREHRACLYLSRPQRQTCQDCIQICHSCTALSLPHFFVKLLD